MDTDWEYQECCINCSHGREEHKSITETEEYCERCWEGGRDVIDQISAMHNFKLDNLQLIEDVAKHKGLI